MSDTPFEALLSLGRPVLADGAMGTALMELGGRPGEAYERWVLDPARAPMVGGVHAAYREAGAAIVLSATFGANPWRLGGDPAPDEIVSLNRAAALLARAAAPGALIAGSIGPSGRLLAPLGDLEPAGAADGFEAQARGLVDGGVDVAWIETMADPAEVAAAIEGVRRVAPALPIVVTLVFDVRGRTMMGTTPERVAALLRDLGVAAAGANCGDGPAPVELAIGRMRAADPDLPIVAKANAGLPVATADGVRYPATPDEMAAHALRAVAAGASIVGGCCGTTDAHVRAMAAALGASMGGLAMGDRVEAAERPAEDLGGTPDGGRH